MVDLLLLHFSFSCAISAHHPSVHTLQSSVLPHGVDLFGAKVAVC